MPVASERACREAAGPRPAAVPCNDWRRIRLPEAATFVPTLPVSVVVPCFEAPDALALTLAGLEGQAWPRELFEVVIVDDGSEPPLRRPVPAPLDPVPLEVKVVRQERRGFGLARARNAGARAAAHPILVFLDGDVIPESGLLAVVKCQRLTPQSLAYPIGYRADRCHSTVPNNTGGVHTCAGGAEQCAFLPQLGGGAR